MEHDQLIEEMNQIERLTTAERLRLARYLINYATFYYCLIIHANLRCPVAYSNDRVNQINLYEHKEKIPQKNIKKKKKKN
jgi:hypothetical protein